MATIDIKTITPLEDRPADLRLWGDRGGAYPVLLGVDELLGGLNTGARQYIDAVRAGASVGGDPYLIGSTVAISASTYSAGALGRYFYTGVWNLPKASSESIQAGARVYWDASARQANQSGGLDVGLSTSAAPVGSTSVAVDVSRAGSGGATSTANPMFIPVRFPSGTTEGQPVKLTNGATGIATGIGTSNEGLTLTVAGVILSKSEGVVRAGQIAYWDPFTKQVSNTDADGRFPIGAFIADATNIAGSATVIVYPVGSVGSTGGGTTDPTDPPPDPEDPPEGGPGGSLGRAINAIFSSPVESGTWGTHAKPFAVDSPWNCRPVNPVFGEFQIPDSTFGYFPSIEGGIFSTVFVRAGASDPSRVVHAITGRPGVNTVYADLGAFPTITIPRWPASATPAEGTDGHLDIYDPVTGVIHSLFECRLEGGVVQAGQYNATLIAGSGWGGPSLYYQGARAVGVIPSAGLIRTAEITDGKPMYEHALTMSLDYSGLSPTPPGFIWPATSADTSYGDNTGTIPEGALLMLPPSFDAEAMGSEKMRKVARTLKTYGAYVTDRNLGTPFSIYVEGITETFKLHESYPDVGGDGWSGGAANDLVAVQHALRQVVGQDGFIDGAGNPLPSLVINQRMVSGAGAMHSFNKQLGATGVEMTSYTYDIQNDRVLINGAANSSLSCIELLGPNVTPKWEGGATYVLAVQTSEPGITVALEFLNHSGGSRAKTPYIKGGEFAEVTTKADTFDGMCVFNCITASAVTNGWFRVAAYKKP